MKDIEDLENVQENYDSKKIQDLHKKMQQDMNFSSDDSDQIEEIKEELDEGDENSS